MFKTHFIVIFLCFSAAKAVESAEASEQWATAVPPVVRSVADAAEAFGYCAARAEHYARGRGGDRSMFIEAARDFAYCASVAHCVKATVATSAPTTACPETPAPISCNCHNHTGLPVPYVSTTQRPTTTAATTLCDDHNGYSYSVVSGHCYKLHTAEVNWEEARSECRAEGAWLAVANSLEEAHLLAGLATAAMPDWEYIHIGMYRVSGGNIWKTVTGEDVSESGYNVWSPGQSQWTGAEWSYGRMQRDGYLDPGVYDISRAYICENTPNQSVVY